MPVLTQSPTLSFPEVIECSVLHLPYFDMWMFHFRSSRREVSAIVLLVPVVRLRALPDGRPNGDSGRPVANAATIAGHTEFSRLLKRRRLLEPRVERDISQGEPRAQQATWAQRLLMRDLALVPVIIAVMIAGSFVSPGFLMADNLMNVLQQSSELSILVIAQSLFLICGKFDLSLESTVGLTPMVASWLTIADISIGGSGYGIGPYSGIVVVFALGLLIGLVNGLLVVKLKPDALITTLAMLILLRGTTLGITNGQTLFDLPDAFLYLGTAKWFGIPVSIWIAGILFAVAALFMRYHRIGRAIDAIGGNAEAARVAGIPVERITLCVYIVGGLLAALAGLMLTGRIASVVSSQGQNMIFYVFAAAVIGGISLTGGQGRIVGALTGVILLGLLQNVLTLSQVAAFWIDAVMAPSS